MSGAYRLDSSGRRHTERLAEAGIEPTVLSGGDSCDDALAEPLILEPAGLR